jgi:predicted permease
MAEEMRQHLERRTQEKIADGLAPDAARYAAQRDFGGIAQVQEQCRDERRFLWLDQAVQDVRYAARQLRRNPGFTAVAVATLALGIGATTTIFSLVYGIVLKPLPYEKPAQLVQLFESSSPGEQNSVSPGVFFDWHEQSTLFEGIAAYSGHTLNFNGGGEPERINGVRMSANGLQLLRGHPIVGRLFAAGEDQMGRGNVVVLTQQLWQRRFAGDRDVIGRSILFDDQQYTVIGVLPDRFLPFSNQEFVVPLVLDSALREQRDRHWLRVMGRLKPGVTIGHAQAELEVIIRRIKTHLPAWKQTWTATAVPMKEPMVQRIRPALLVLLGAAGLVLLIACVNVANLLLAKSSTREREIAVRVALGASRGRIVRQLLVESLVLSLFGTALGLLLAFWSVGGLRHLLATMNVARIYEVVLDAHVLAAAAIASLLTGVAFGLVPALHASRRDLNHPLKEAARGVTLTGSRLRGALIAGEVALALVLLAGAGLLLHSFSRILNVSLGFNPKNVMTLQLSLSGPKYPDISKRFALFSQVAERVAALPGVEAAGLTQTLPLRYPPESLFRVAGRADEPPPGFGAQVDYCTLDYLRTLSIPLLHGRMFQAQDAEAGARVAIVNASLAREFFPGENPLGRYLEQGGAQWEIIGVVGDVPMIDLTRPNRPLVYRLRPASTEGWWSATLAVRTRNSAAALADLRRLIREIDPAQPIANVRLLEEVISSSLSERRLILGLLGAFSMVALLLAAIGLYGVISYAVTQRTREFGIRVALGATRRDVLRLVLGHGIKLVAIGLTIGLVGALSLSHLLVRLLYEISPTDPVTLALVSVILVAVACLASWLPARRAANIHPMNALRAE